MTDTQNKDAHKQRCRQAAQWRRLLENLEYDQLASCLPMHQEVSRSLLDKAGLVRMAISYLRLHRFINDGLPSWEVVASDGERNQYNRATDGFLFCLSESFQILYVSETVSLGFGLSQIDLIGTSLLQYIYKDDVQVFLSLANQCCPDAGPGIAKAVLRMWSTLTRRNCKEKSEQPTGYKVIMYLNVY
ncbi:unnamed protein product [Soboliphyme baturini]|uniref:BHLH domain-containing protein n=1 Tax=Soboliphyme baturini TaxID=241478 RepID=A0A183ILD6_9BILA|nr:unnamed protein product [Soboliphyme baturini]